MTGGTGLVGSFLIPRLLRGFPGSTIALLVRSTRERTAHERIADLAAHLRDVHGFGDASRRLQALPGDVGRPDLGLDTRTRAELQDRATWIIHGAATIRFDSPLADARATNTEGTRRVLDLALGCRALQRLAYIGTSSVSGDRAGIVREDELERGQVFFNTYEQSKCESERLIRDHADRLPVVIFRPSIIIGDSRTGYTTLFNVIYIPLRLIDSGTLDTIPARGDTLLDLVPVDWVTDAMVYLMRQGESVGRAFHLTAGPSRAEHLEDLLRRAVTYFDREHPLSRPRNVRIVSPAAFEDHRKQLSGAARALADQLGALFPYVSVNRLFDTSNADALLRTGGIEFPRFSTYADRIFEFCLHTRWGKRLPAGPPATG